MMTKWRSKHWDYITIVQKKSIPIRVRLFIFYYHLFWMCKMCKSFFYYHHTCYAEYLLAALYNKTEHTEPFKCYLQCIFDSLGLVRFLWFSLSNREKITFVSQVDSNNQVNLEKLINFAPTEIHEHILELHRACDTQRKLVDVNLIIYMKMFDVLFLFQLAKIAAILSTLPRSAIMNLNQHREST